MVLSEWLVTVTDGADRIVPILEGGEYRVFLPSVEG